DAFSGAVRPVDVVLAGGAVARPLLHALARLEIVAVEASATGRLEAAPVVGAGVARSTATEVGRGFHAVAGFAPVRRFLVPDVAEFAMGAALRHLAAPAVPARRHHA